MDMLLLVFYAAGVETLYFQNEPALVVLLSVSCQCVPVDQNFDKIFFCVVFLQLNESILVHQSKAFVGFCRR